MSILKVLHIVDYYPYYAGKVVEEIAKRLTKKGVIVKVISSNLMASSGNSIKENVVRLKASRVTLRDTSYIIYDLRDLMLLKEQLDVDIIHLHFLYSFLSLYIGIIKKLKKIEPPIVATSHGLTSGYESTIVEMTAKLLDKLSKKLVITGASAITTVSKLEYDYLVRIFPHKRLYYIPNGIDRSFFKPDNNKRRILRDRLGIDSDDFLVLYFAHLRAAKGVFTFLKAMHKVVSRTDFVKFIIAGYGPSANYIKQIKEKYKKRLNTFLGYISDKDLPYLYNACDIYVLPSHVEGMPLSVMEAMACGKPVIVTSVGDMPFIVKNGVNGIVIPPGNAELLANGIIYLAKNKELRNLMAELNLRKMAKYDWDKISNRYYSLYAEMLDRAKF